MAITVSVHRSIRALPCEEWDACFPGDPESWAYLRAIEDARLSAFSWLYLAAEEKGRIVAAVPAFITEYNLSTTVQGTLRSAVAPLTRMLGGLLTLKLACLGSPLTDKCPLGFAPGFPASRRAEVVSQLLDSLDRFASGQSIGLIAAKDAADDDLVSGVAEAFARAGFSCQPSLPNAVLPLPYASEEEYLRSLSQGTRRDVRRKLKSAGRVRVETRGGAEALELVPELLRLYDRQRNRSGVDFDQFESLTPEYFRNVLAEGAMRPIVFLYFHDDRLVAFNLCYHTDRLFIDKFVGFDDTVAAPLNLYVVSWMTNVRYCLEHRIGALQTGQTGYAMKRRLGSLLQPNWIFFRHRNAAANFVLRLAGPLLAPERYDGDIVPPPSGTK
jgi:predicted N-acyltransferase